MASGRYQNASEALRAGLRLLERDEGEFEMLRARVMTGLQAARQGELAERSGEEAIRRAFAAGAGAGLMARSWRLTRAADTALVEIARWTETTFGPGQARAWEADLNDTCQRIAAGTALTMDCRRLIGPDLAEHLRFARCGQHFVIFVEDAEQVIIIALNHSRSDLPGRLAALDAEEDDGPFGGVSLRTDDFAVPAQEADAPVRPAQENAP